MDQSQKSAEATPRVSDAELIRSLKKPAADESEGQKANRQLAIDQLSMMSELRTRLEFKWFMQTFVDEPYKASFDALKSGDTDLADMPKVLSRYRALRGVKAGILEREIVWREMIDRSDPEIARLREQEGQL